MSIVPKNEQNNKQRASRRRRKKRRTEDFSDSSDSSSSSDNEVDDEDNALRDPKSEINEKDAEDHDVDVVLSDNETNVEIDEIASEKEKFNNVKLKLKTVSLTKTGLNDKISKNININELSKTLDESKKNLEDEFLGLMFENYGDDINNLRGAPDFNERSLSILATVLKNGGNIFDEDTLKAVVNK